MTSLTMSPLVSVVTLVIVPTISLVLGSTTMTAIAAAGSKHEEIGTARSAPVPVETGMAAAATACAEPTTTVLTGLPVLADVVATAKTECVSASAG